jgi:hypothetical protein
MHSCVLCGSQKKQRLFLYTALTYRLLKSKQRVFTELRNGSLNRTDTVSYLKSLTVWHQVLPKYFVAICWGTLHLTSRTIEILCVELTWDYHCNISNIPFEIMHFAQVRSRSLSVYWRFSYQSVHSFVCQLFSQCWFLQFLFAPVVIQYIPLITMSGNRGYT